MSRPSYAKRCAAESIGTALLLAIIVGSGIMGERLSSGSAALALLANSLATGAGLAVLILVFGPISGAHFNPLVTLSMATRGTLPWREAPALLASQFIGAFTGVGTAHLMFGKPVLALSTHSRSGLSLGVSEAIATFGLLGVVLGLSRHRSSAMPFAVGAYITAAYWFTASTSFANPAVTVARAFTDTFTGIRFSDVPGFLVAQVLGAVAAVALFRWFDATDLRAT